MVTSDGFVVISDGIFQLGQRPVQPKDGGLGQGRIGWRCNIEALRRNVSSGPLSRTLLFILTANPYPVNRRTVRTIYMTLSTEAKHSPDCPKPSPSDHCARPNPNPNPSTLARPDHVLVLTPTLTPQPWPDLEVCRTVMVISTTLSNEADFLERGEGGTACSGNSSSSCSRSTTWSAAMGWG